MHTEAYLYTLVPIVEVVLYGIAAAIVTIVVESRLLALFSIAVVVVG